MDKETLVQLLECPVCRDTPGAKIFHCKNGHNVCDQCFKRCGDRCPVCRVPYGTKKLRNLQLEEIRDMSELEVNCPHSEQGCLEKMQKKDLSTHEKVCSFRPFCMMLGYKCNGVAGNDHSKIVHHLQIRHLTHSGSSWRSTDASKEVEAIISRNHLQYTMRKQESLEGFVMARQGNFAFLKLEDGKSDDPLDFMVCLLTNFRYHAFLCLYMGASAQDANKYRAKFSLTMENGFKEEWTTGVPHFLNFLTALENPPYPINLNTLLQFMSNKIDKCTLQCRVTSHQSIFSV